MSSVATSSLQNGPFQGSDRRIAILNSARTVFLDRGYNLASMADIAAEANVSTSTVYKEFNSKDELLTHVVRTLYKNIEQDSEKAILDTGLSITDEMIVLITSGGSVLSQYQISKIFTLAISEGENIPPEVHRIIDEGRVFRYRLIANYLDRKIEEGVLKPHDTLRTGQLFMGVVREFFGWQVYLGIDLTVPPDGLDRFRDLIGMYVAAYKTEKT